MSTETSLHNPPLCDKEPTLNGKGHTFNTRCIASEYWLASLPESELPLADVGACYGVHTLAALAKGRDVIAVDSAAKHLAELRRRVAQQAAEQPDSESNKLGKLVGCVHASIPAQHIMAKGSVSGVLLSEVMHFLNPGEPLQFFYDAFEWLCDEGTLAISTASLSESTIAAVPEGADFNKGRTKEEVRNLLETKTGEQLLDECPGVVYYSRLGWDGHFNLQTTMEMCAMAKLAGFKVLQCYYYSQGKYGQFGAKNQKNESVLLIAKKSS